MGQNKAQTKENIWALLKKYNPDAHHFMTALYNMPTKVKVGNMTMTTSKATDFMVWVDNNSGYGLLGDLGTVVHESSHGYSSKRAYPMLAEKGINFHVDYEHDFLRIRKNTIDILY